MHTTIKQYPGNISGSCGSNQADMMMWENLSWVCIFVNSGLYLVCILAKKWSVFGLFFSHFWSVFVTSSTGSEIFIDMFMGV